MLRERVPLLSRAAVPGNCQTRVLLDALTMLDSTGQPITFSEWSYLGKGRFHRRDFRFDTLTQMSAFGEEDTLFADMGKHEIFTPTNDHGALHVREIGKESK